MGGGLIDDPAGRGTYHTMHGPGSTSPAQSPGGVGTTVNVGQAGGQTVNSHLDSFFDSSGWTREDVMVVASAVQLLAWAALLYVEVQR